MHHHRGGHRGGASAGSFSPRPHGGHTPRPHDPSKSPAIPNVAWESLKSQMIANHTHPISEPLIDEWMANKFDVTLWTPSKPTDTAIKSSPKINTTDVVLPFSWSKSEFSYNKTNLRHPIIAGTLWLTTNDAASWTDNVMEIYIQNLKLDLTHYINKLTNRSIKKSDALEALNSSTDIFDDLFPQIILNYFNVTGVHLIDGSTYKLLNEWSSDNKVILFYGEKKNIVYTPTYRQFPPDKVLDILREQRRIVPPELATKFLSKNTKDNMVTMGEKFGITVPTKSTKQDILELILNSPSAPFIVGLV